MAGSVGEKDVYDEINITPMLDLAYVLLIIFIILTTAISITADGTLYLDTFPVTMTELENLLRQYKAAKPDLPVIIKADSTIQYQKVVDVLDLMGRLEISQLGL